MKVLVVDDDPNLLDAFAHSFYAEWPDCQVVCASTSSEALMCFATVEPDLILLDVRLPGEGGFEVLRRIRHVSDVPILLITGYAGEMDEIRGLQLGADDYLAKPVTQRLFVARVRSMLRRDEQPARDRRVPERVVGDLAINFRTHEVSLRGERVQLTPIEFKLLYHLAQTPGQLIRHRKLIELVWNRPSENVGRLHVNIKRLRGKIEGNRSFIENERGLGYRFVGPESPYRSPPPETQVS
jgi:DNA-binding response OmpR family regulator